MRVKNKLIAFAVGALLISAAQAQPADSPVLMTINGDDVTLSEFESIYKKNNANAALDQQSLEEYLELFVNFKLKVKEAEKQGLDTVGSFRKELTGYRAQLAQPYLVDRNVTDALIREAYERMKEEVNASHILIRVDQAAGSNDTLVAYRKAMSIRKQLTRGSDFAELAARMSGDPSAKENGGNLGYFSALKMVYPFESAAFKTPVGEISKPVRTRFGYHILKINDRRPARGEIRIAHIMVKTDEKYSPAQHAQAKQKIDELYASVQKGEPFEQVAKLYSDDKTSAKKGGELPVFSTGRMVAEFEDAAFALAADGDVSEPIKTDYGWHIIKRLERISLGDFEDLEAEIKRGVKRDGRGNKGKEALLRTVKKEYGYKPDVAARDEVIGKLDSTYLQRQWNAEKAGLANSDKVLFTLIDSKYGNNSKKYTQQDLVKFLMDQMRRIRPQSMNVIQDQLWKQFEETSLLDFEDANLENKYPEFKALVKEYRDGILLFELMNQKVWTKAVTDTAGLQEYYEGHKNNFLWDKRVEASIYTCADQSIAEKVYKVAQKRGKKNISDQAILDKFNKDSQLALKIESGKFLKGENDIIDKIQWKPGVTPMETQDGKVLFVEVKRVIESEPKALDEARGMVTSQYQNYLEEAWIKELRSNYKVNINREVLSQLK